MAAFFLFDVRAVTDPEKLGAYRAGVLATVTAHGGRYRILGGPAEVVEGAGFMETPVLIEFPDRAAAERWYGSDLYRPLRELRQAGADCAALLIEGCDERPAALAG